MYYRRMPKFEYFGPETLKDAISLVEKYKGKVRVLAGGTILVNQMKRRVGNWPYVVGLKAIKELEKISFDDKTGLTIGAMTTLQAIAESAIVNEKCPMLAIACRKLGTPQLRNMGTIGGNISSRFTTAETIPVFIAVNAEARTVNGSGSKNVPVQELYKEFKDGDILAEIIVPAAKADTKWGYEKFAVRERYDFATVSAAAIASVSKGQCTNIRFALGGVTLPSMRAEESEKVLSGQKLDDALIAKAAELASESGKIGSDVYFTAEYKKELLRVVAKRVLKQALGA